MQTSNNSGPDKGIHRTAFVCISIPNLSIHYRFIVMNKNKNKKQQQTKKLKRVLDETEYNVKKLGLEK